MHTSFTYFMILAKVLIYLCLSLILSREFQKYIYFYFVNYTKVFHCVDHNKLWKIHQEMGKASHLTCLQRNVHAGQEATVRTRHGTTDWFQIRKEYLKAIYSHLAYLTYMQSTSFKMLGWMKHKLGSRLPGEISITSDTKMTSPQWQKVKKN